MANAQEQVTTQLAWLDVLSAVSNGFTILASAIAIFIFIAKRKELSLALNILIGYTHQITLSELKEKLERLNEFNAANAEESVRIVNILHELLGQIRGSKELKESFGDTVEEIERLADPKNLTEPRKRALVSEIRERLRHQNLAALDGIVGVRDE